MDHDLLTISHDCVKHRNAQGQTAASCCVKFAFGRRLFECLCFWLISVVPVLQADELRLGIALRQGQPAPYSHSTSSTGLLLTLEGSADLKLWSEICRAHNSLSLYPELSSATPVAKFYRLRARTRSPDTDDWSNQLCVTNSLFFAAPQIPGGATFVKLTLDLAQPGRVYFQDSSVYPYHYDFIKKRIPGYSDMTMLDFDQWALQAADQRLAIGVVLRAPDPQIHEAALIFDAYEPLPVERVVEWFHLTTLRLTGTEGWRFFYFPIFEQILPTLENAAFFQNAGVAVDFSSRWTKKNTSYSDGWALGRLVIVAGTNISAAFRSGQITGADILVTDQIPAEIPYVSGVVVFRPATPNSHAVLFARSFAAPFAYVAGTALKERIQTLNGQEVLYVVSTDTNGVCTVTLTETAGRLTEQRRQEILASRRPPTLAFPARELYGTLVVSCDRLSPADARYVGGKSAWYSLLRRAIPDRTPEAIAFTFDLWDGYMKQTLPTGETLGEAIRIRLQPHEVYPPDAALLSTNLAEVRRWITDVANFNSAQRTQILAALSGFATNRNIRFRSSANVEDGETYSAAGLYDSYSGCLGDDLDGNSSGPSCCDPTETNERGVFRAMRKVFASFYNENAFTERRRLGLVETNTGMAILAHYSFPDTNELANGVAVLEGGMTNGIWEMTASLVTQTGAVSVTNPSEGQQAEIVHALYRSTPTNAVFEIRQHSSLMTNNTPVLQWERDYRELLGYLHAVAETYKTATGPREQLALDFEYKMDRNNGLQIKQVRPLPRPPSVPVPEI